MKYTAPEMEIVVVETEDVILASSGDTTTTTLPKPGELPPDEF